MDLDQRAADAAAYLRGDVTADLDLDGAYDRVLAGTGARRVRLAGVRIGLVAVVALVAVAGLAVLVSVAGPIDDDVADGARDEEEMMTHDGLGARGAAILGGLPDGPLDGRESWRLPVVADDPTDLRSGDTVTLYGKGFVPGETVGAVHCSSEADTANAGVGACDLGDAEYVFAHTISGTARYDGSVVITVEVRQVIETPDYGRVDCASAPERCLLAIGASTDYDRSGGTYIDFAGAPPFPEATTSIDPVGPYTAGQQVTIQAGGLIAGRSFQVLQCAGEDHCASLSQGRASAEGVYGATVAIGSAVDVAGEVVACEDRCTLAVRGIGLPDQTTAPVPDAIVLGPIAGEAVAVTPPTTAPADPGTAEPIPETSTPMTPTPTVPPTTDGVPPSTATTTPR